MASTSSYYRLSLSPSFYIDVPTSFFPPSHDTYIPFLHKAMNATDAKSFSHLLHRYGGSPIGSFASIASAPLFQSIHGPAPMTPSIPHAMFMDVTHDNETPAQKVL